jgi:hypothetical protein
MDEQRKLMVAKMTMLAIEEIVLSRLAGIDIEPFEELVEAYGRSQQVTAEEARELLSQPLGELFQIN